MVQLVAGGARELILLCRDICMTVCVPRDSLFFAFLHQENPLIIRGIDVHCYEKCVTFTL